MANVIKLKRGSGSDPSASDLVVGEVAIRTDSGKLFTKKDNGTIAEISGSGGGSDIFINTLSSSSGSGGGSATFNGTATRFTLSNPPAVSAQQLLVSINGVIQKPNSGTSPSEGFAIDGNDIIFAAAPATGSDFFIVTYGSLNIAVPADNSVTSAKIADGAIVNADINASAAIAGTKIAPDFGSQNIVTTGGLTVDTSTFHVDTSNNRVGIGTTSPTASIESQGNVSSTTQFSGFQGLRIQNANGAAHGVTADINFVAGTGSDNRGAVIGVEFTSTANGNDLYFATNPNSVSSNDTPIERLRITSAGDIRIPFANNSTGLRQKIQFVTEANFFDEVAYISVNRTAVSGAPSDMVFATGSVGSVSERLKIDSSGNVQIPNDSVFLQIGASQDFDLHHNGTNSYIRNKTGNLHIRPLAAEEGIILIPNGELELFFDNAKKFDTYAAGVEVIGNLYIKDGDITNNRVALGTGGDFSIYHDGSSNWIIATNGDLIVQSNGYAIRSENGSSTFATIDSSGETRLLAGADGTNKSTIELRNGSSSGTTNRLLYGLHSATTTSNGTGIYSIFTNGTVGTPSDIRLKKNVETTRDGYLSDLANLRVVKYHWKTQEDTEPKELGLIAQEVEKIFPGLIHTEGEGSDEVKEIKRSVLPFMLLKALQEAIAKIETLETKVAALEAG